MPSPLKKRDKKGSVDHTVLPQVGTRQTSVRSVVSEEFPHDCCDITYIFIPLFPLVCDLNGHPLLPGKNVTTSNGCQHCVCLVSTVNERSF